MGYLKRKRKNEEKTLQKAVVDYLKLKYHHLKLLIRSDLAGVNLSRHQQKEHKFRSKSGDKFDAFPDLAVYHKTPLYSGLFLELKKENTKLKDRNGNWYKGHIEDQAKTLERLRAQGFYAEFGVGIDDCMQKIDEYFNGPTDEQVAQGL